MKEWISDYQIEALDGAVALTNSSLIEQLQTTWAQSYRQSTEPTQANDPKYADNDEARQARLQHIKQELSQPSAILIIVKHGEVVVGFFWGLSMTDLDNIDTIKADQVKQIIQSSQAEQIPQDWSQVAYLSMMGVVSTGQQLGRHLTTAILAAFKSKNYTHAVARTINQLAWKATYQPLGFILYGDFFDHSTQSNRLIFGKKLD